MTAAPGPSAAPRVAMNAHRNALVEKLMRERGIEPSGRAATIPRRDPATPPQLSFGQERLWILDRLDPQSWAYVICQMIRLPVAVNGRVMENAVNAIVARHETLRCNIRDDGSGRPELVIDAERRVALAREDLSRRPEAERLEEVARIAGIEARTPFDLAADPLLRATLIKLAPQDHVIVLAIHHIVSDAWSFDVFFNELFALYNATAQDRSAPLEVLPIQYSDFAAWQRKELAGARLQTLLDYWRRQLADAPPVTAMPTDFPRPAVRSGRGARHGAQLEAEEIEPLRLLARDCGATLYMGLLAAFKVLVFRISGEPRVVVGSPSANRNRSEIEGLIGFFVNTLVLHTDLSGDPSFREALVRVRDVALGAAAHQDLPFEKLVEDLKPQRSRAHNPLFQIMFNLQNGLRPVAGPAAATGEPAPVEGSPKFDIEWALLEHPSGATLTVEYTTDLYAAETIAGLIAAYRELIARAVRAPDQLLSILTGTAAAGEDDGDDFEFDD